MKKTIVSVFLMLLVSCSGEVGNKVTDFDRVCNAFEALSKDSKLNELSGGDRDLFIFHEIRDLDAKSNAKHGWASARNAVPVERYTLYKDVVDSIEHGDWSCLAMKELAPTFDIVYIEEEGASNVTFPEPASLEDADFQNKKMALKKPALAGFFISALKLSKTKTQ